MKDKIIQILRENLEGREHNYNEAVTELLNLYGVTPRFSVSLVYQNPKANMLRTLVTDASSKEEALGIAIEYLKEETDGFGLILKSVIHLNEG